MSILFSKLVFSFMDSLGDRSEDFFGIKDGGGLLAPLDMLFLARVINTLSKSEAVSFMLLAIVFYFRFRLIAVLDTTSSSAVICCYF